MKAMQAKLWSVWLYGFLLIALSLYATQQLPPFQLEIKPPSFHHTRLTHLACTNITIFSAPDPFPGPVQTLAIRSWLALSPQITVVLFSQHPSVASFARAFGSRVLVDPNIDFTFIGTPFFHSMVERSRIYSADISVFIDSQTVVMRDLISTLNYAYKLDHDWLLVASLPNVSYFPFSLDEAGKYWVRKDDRNRIKLQELQEIIGQSWQWNYCADKMLMAWNSRNLPLHNGVLPPFLYSRGIHNHWVINEAVLSELRFVFDASWTITSFYLNDPEHWSHQSARGSCVLGIGNRSWEDVGNCHLGALYGSLFFHEINYFSLVKLANCDGQYLFADTEKIVNPFVHQRLNLWNRKILHSWVKKKNMACVDNIKSKSGITDCSLRDQLQSLAPLDFPFSLESLLSVTADKNNTIVLAVAGYSYKDMLMSWVCRLRSLLVRNFIICALDHETYEFSILQGLPVFHDPSAPRNISFNDCHFGTKCFQRVTKVKSRMVLKILKLGYNVLLSDVDVYWFENPLPLLHSFGPAVLVAQSDEYNKTGPVNLPRRLNSGFYFARSDGSTIAAMEKVVKHAATSGMSEQPSFYDTLCGEGGANRINDDKCIEPETNLTVHFLDRNLFPNGLNSDSCREAKTKKELGGDPVSLDLCLPSKVVSVRIVRAGGRKELYQYALPASQLMEKYPGTCVARPEVFKNPQESLLWPDEKLLPGHKYLVIPSTTAQKLTREHMVRGATEGKDETLDANRTWDVDGDFLEESVFSAKDFYMSKDRRPSHVVKKTVRSKKPFVPPLPKARSFRGLGWEPSLTSVRELSP